MYLLQNYDNAITAAMYVDDFLIFCQKKKVEETETYDKIQKQSGALARCKKNNMIQTD
jgi:hypothetical protein